MRIEPEHVYHHIFVGGRGGGGGGGGGGWVVGVVAVWLQFLVCLGDMACHILIVTTKVKGSNLWKTNFFCTN